jgi:hypothetical protein
VLRTSGRGCERVWKIGNGENVLKDSKMGGGDWESGRWLEIWCGRLKTRKEGSKTRLAARKCV